MKTPKKLILFLKTMVLTALIILSFGLANLNTAQAQEFSTGADVVSTYVWRGVAYAGPSIQPYVEFSSGSFTIGAWGSQGIDGLANTTTGFQEMDLYLSYSFDFGLSLGLTDYYYPGSPYFSYSEDAANGDFSSHAFEINAGYSIDALSLSGNFILNEATGAGSAGSDMYFEAGYSITDAASVFVGAGDGWHSSNGDFALVNIGITSSKELVVSETFTIPLFGSVVLNPDTEQFYILAGVSF